MSKNQRFRGQLFVLSLFSAILSVALLVDWSEAQAQEKKAEKKAVAAKNAKAKSDAPKVAVRPTPGTGKKLQALELTKIIDQEITRKLKEEGIKASPLADDGEFIRRASLDLTGTIPGAERVASFLDDKNPKKRELLIDELLNNPRYGQFLAENFVGYLVPRDSNNRRLSNANFQNWLRDNFNKNTPVNTLVHELLTATGDIDKVPATTYFVSNPTVDKITDNVTKMFLGVQLQCAQCHNHPFTEWKQKEYWGMAQFFINVRLTATPQAAAKKGVSPGIIESPKAVGKKNQLPESAMKVNAKFLGDKEVKLEGTKPYRPEVANWITSPQNPFFAKAMVNRFWYQMFGRGIVNPVDDMHDNNDPSHPELLAALTEQFKTSGFDLKYLMKAICNSQAYQRSSKPVGDNADDMKFYSHRAIRVMGPEQIYDSLSMIVGKDNSSLRGTKDKKTANGGNREQFLTFFRVDDGYDPLEYQNGIPQALRLMNSSQTNVTKDVVSQAVKVAGNDPAKVIERLYLGGVSRRPTGEELTKIQQYVNKASDKNGAYNDLVWALINSSEFMLNH